MDAFVEKENLRINNHYPLSEKEYINIINRFKEAYEDIKQNDLTTIDCVIEDTNCQVKGNYDVTLVLPSEEIIVKGKWSVEFNWDDDYWEIVNVQIEGINF